jgi:hypothetical protein
VVSDLGHGWKLDAKPYTYSYKNHHWYTDPPLTTFNATYCATPISGNLPCASDQLNGYHKYGDLFLSRHDIQRQAIVQKTAHGSIRTCIVHEADVSQPITEHRVIGVVCCHDHVYIIG